MTYKDCDINPPRSKDLRRRGMTNQVLLPNLISGSTTSQEKRTFCECFRRGDQVSERCRFFEFQWPAGHERFEGYIPSLSKATLRIHVLWACATTKLQQVKAVVTEAIQEAGNFRYHQCGIVDIQNTSTRVSLAINLSPPTLAQRGTWLLLSAYLWRLKVVLCLFCCFWFVKTTEGVLRLTAHGPRRQPLHAVDVEEHAWAIKRLDSRHSKRTGFQASGIQPGTRRSNLQDLGERRGKETDYKGDLVSMKRRRQETVPAFTPPVWVKCHGFIEISRFSNRHDVSPSSNLAIATRTAWRAQRWTDCVTVCLKDSERLGTFGWRDAILGHLFKAVLVPGTRQTPGLSNCFELDSRTSKRREDLDAIQLWRRRSLLPLGACVNVTVKAMVFVNASSHLPDFIPWLVVGCIFAHLLRMGVADCPLLYGITFLQGDGISIGTGHGMYTSFKTISDSLKCLEVTSRLRVSIRSAWRDLPNETVSPLRSNPARPAGPWPPRQRRFQQLGGGFRIVSVPAGKPTDLDLVRNLLPNAMILI
ncbi:hypothetical protein EDD85DRAFT_992225 [Armillaria nabsnona]|nr:hypothetical protein EDD85DRAFT_992225 [Armillaria nabsnona]